MSKWKATCILSLLVICLSSFSQSSTEGSLVIVGGGLDEGNKSIFNPLIELAGGVEKASFAIIPAASGSPVQSYISFRKTLIFNGIKPDHIHLINIALVDDDSTGNVNESVWKDNGSNIQLAELVKKCSVVWFSGGDQLRIIKTLINPDGSNTPVLNAVWEVFRSGGVVGGTSAGAAIMSEAMIGGGNSLGALTHGVITNYQGDDFPEGDGVLMTKGLGFFPIGIVDQHFNQRSRVGRLIVALFHEKERYSLGFGVDENTALIYMGSQKTIKVAGASGVTIINTHDAAITYHQNLPEITNLKVSYLSNGDSYNIGNGNIIPSKEKKLTQGKEYYTIQNPGQAGLFSGYSSGMIDLLTVNLMDNKGASQVRNISFCEQNSGFMCTFTKLPESKGYYTDEPDGEDHYTLSDVRMDISPVQVSITPVK